MMRFNFTIPIFIKKFLLNKLTSFYSNTYQPKERFMHY